MFGYWKKESAGDTDGIWFVAVEAARVSVLSPPGVPLCRAYEREEDVRRRSYGWRWAIWSRDDGDDCPLIDEKPPSAIREMDTVEVLRLLEAEMHEMVWACLWAQLQIARGIGRQRRGAIPSEDLARAGARSASWLTHELRRSFPERAHLLELPSPSNELEVGDEAPEDLAELSCRDRQHGLVHPPAERPRLRGGLAGWLAWKLFVRERPEIGWHDPEPGDRSGHGWTSDRDLVVEIATDEFATL
jgi:hypothetical protein